jgi:hypothetical protein
MKTNNFVDNISIISGTLNLFIAVLQLADQLIERVTALHLKSIIHRDIKPVGHIRNVLSVLHCTVLRVVHTHTCHAHCVL